MLGILLDIAALACVLYFMGSDESRDFWKIGITVGAITIANVVIALGLAGALGILFLVPMFFVNALIIMYAFDMTWLGTAVATGAFVIYKFIMVLVFASL